MKPSGECHDTRHAMIVTGYDLGLHRRLIAGEDARGPAKLLRRTGGPSTKLLVQHLRAQLEADGEPVERVVARREHARQPGDLLPQVDQPALCIERPPAQDVLVVVRAPLTPPGV